MRAAGPLGLLGKARRALLFEGGDAFGEVGMAGGDGLIVGFDIEDALEGELVRLVDRALDEA